MGCGETCDAARSFGAAPQDKQRVSILAAKTYCEGRKESRLRLARTRTVAAKTRRHHGKGRGAEPQSGEVSMVQAAT